VFNPQDALLASFIISTIAGALRSMTPILLTAIGENFAESSGILNLGTEGIMLIAAFTGFITTLATNSIIFGLLMAMLVGTMLGLIIAFITVTLQADQIVTGIALTMFSLGITSYMVRIIYGTGLPPRVPSMELTTIPLLASIPVGPTIFTQPFLVWVSLILIPVTYYILFKTSFGLKLRAVGEDPRSAYKMGVNVYLYRYVALIIGGVLAGLGGAYLSLFHISTFVDNITQGRGWIAIAIVMFGRWNPLWILVGGLIYGGAESLSGSIQALGVLRGVPTEFMLTLPYILTIAALGILSKRATFPAALGKPYKKETS